MKTGNKIKEPENNISSDMLIGTGDRRAVSVFLKVRYSKLTY